MYLTPPERYYIMRYFDAVSTAIGTRMVSGSRPLEDRLTFLLGELLDDNFTSQHVLDYGLNQLHADLVTCGDFHRVSVVLETHEHNQHFEGKYSFADLGMVVKNTDYGGSSFEKAVLVQAKRLYEEDDEYSLYSQYKGFDSKQFERLHDLCAKYGSNAACYIFYSPLLSAFREADYRRILDLENRRRYSMVGSMVLTPTLSIHLELPRAAHSFHVDEGQVRRYLEYDARYGANGPGVRVCGMESIGRVTKQHADQVRIGSLYKDAIDHPYHIQHAFVPLSCFVVDCLFGCNYGEQEPSLIKLAQGKVPVEQASEEQLPIHGVKHTLTILIRATAVQG